MFKRALGSTVVGACVALCLIAPISANGSTTSLWVSNSAPVSSPGNSCAHPGFTAIQPAVAAAAPSGATVHLCPGTYTEQLTITKAIKLVAVDAAGSVKVVLPAAPSNSKTTCDEAPGTGSFQPDQDGVSICTAGTVTITGLTFEPKWAGSVCDESLYGILVAGGATLKATNVTVDGGGASPINGCQGGVAIQVGMAWTSPVEVGHATLAHDTVTEYQKNGITVDGAGSSATVTSTNVVGAGATTQTAQNGIQVSNGALGVIKSSTVTGNECDNASCGPEGFSQTQATGLLFYGAATGSLATGSTLEGNDVGAYFVSQSATQPTSPEVTISKDVFNANRYESVALDQGDASVKGDTITGPGEIGIDIFQYAGQSYAPTSGASGDSISGMSEAAVEVQTDNAAGDKSGSFTISKSSISGNAHGVEDESTTFKVFL